MRHLHMKIKVLFLDVKQPRWCNNHKICQYFQLFVKCVLVMIENIDRYKYVVLLPAT